MIPLLTSVVANFARPSSRDGLVLPQERSQNTEAWFILLMSGFLVSVPVFLQAPLVRSFPWLSLALTVGWLIFAIALMRNPNPKIAVWGVLFLGFSWSWLAGSIDWGWFRWEPLIHLPIEAIALPVAIW